MARDAFLILAPSIRCGVCGERISDAGVVLTGSATEPASSLCICFTCVRAANAVVEQHAAAVSAFDCDCAACEDGDGQARGRA